MLLPDVTGRHIVLLTGSLIYGRLFQALDLSPERAKSMALESKEHGAAILLDSLLELRDRLAVHPVLFISQAGGHSGKHAVWVDLSRDQGPGAELSLVFLLPPKASTPDMRWSKPDRGSRTRASLASAICFR